MWVDPRSGPTPPYRGPPRPLAALPDDVESLIELCDEGAIYAVERWIQAGKPLQADYRGASLPSVRTPLQAAMRRHLDDMVLLLLCNGYDPNAEPWSPFDDALDKAPYPYLETLWSWGADPTRADPDLVVGTYQTAIITRFIDAGLDILQVNCLVRALGHHSTNRALYGIVRARCTTTPGYQRALNAALGCQVQRANARGIALCRWAGADPRATVTYTWSSEQPTETEDPEGRHFTAIELALYKGHPEFLQALGFSPANEEVPQYYTNYLPLESLRFLAKLAPPADWAPIIAWRFHFMRGFRDSRAHLWELRPYLELGVRLSKPNAEFREGLSKILKHLDDYDRHWLLRWLSNLNNCSPEFLADLLTRPVVKRAFQNERLPKSTLLGLAALQDQQPTAAAFAAKNLVKAKAMRRSRMTYQAPNRRYACSRRELADAVWERPVERVATTLGMSGPALKKHLRAWHIPSPPRGYWARLQAGQRPDRPRLPSLPPGGIELIYLACPPDGSPAPAPSTSATPATQPPGPAGVAPVAPAPVTASPSDTPERKPAPAADLAASGDRFAQYNHWQRQHIFSQMHRRR